MSISQTHRSLNETRRDELKEKLMLIFGASEESLFSKKEIDDRVSTMVENFLSTTAVSSDIDLGPLIDNFTDSKIPVEPSDVAPYIDYLSEKVVAHSVRTSSPRCIGNMTTITPYFMRHLGSLMMAMNQNLVKVEASKALSPYERQALAMMHRLVYGFSDEFYSAHIQHRESTLGVMVSGGTLANITALWCARNAALGPKDGFAGIVSEGLPAALDFYGYSGAVIIGSELMHYSIDKAADLLGIGARSLIKLAVDHKQRISVTELRRRVAECQARNQLIIAIVGIAGTTDYGSIEPLADMAEVAQAHGVHFHVDAAWGGPLLFSERHMNKLAGIEQADSVTIDGHKQMYLPTGIGMVILRSPEMARFIEKQAHYTVRASSADLGRRALEGSRSGRAMFLHAALHVIGKKGYSFLIEEGIRKARYMADALEARSEFELLTEPETNILIYRCIPEPWRGRISEGPLTDEENEAINKFNKRLHRAQRRAGASFVSRTTVDATRHGKGASIVALRAVISNPLTTEEDIDEVLADQVKWAAGVSSL